MSQRGGREAGTLLHRPAIAILLALLLLPVASPVAAESSSLAFRGVPVYFVPSDDQGATLTSVPLPQQSWPQRAPTNALQGTGAPLPAPLVVARDAAFRVEVPYRQSTPGQVETTVTVSVEGAFGERAVLASATVRAHRADPHVFVDETEETPLPLDAGPAGPLVASLDDHWRNARDTLGSASEGSLGWHATNLTYETLAAHPLARPATGRWDGPAPFAAWRWCTPAPFTPQQGLIQHYSYVAFMAADNATYDATRGAPVEELDGFRFCRDQRPVYDGVGRRTDAQLPGVLPLLPEELPRPPQPTLPGGLPYPNVTVRHDAQGWVDITLDATPASWMPQDDASFVLVEGLRLAVEVSARVVGEPPGAPGVALLPATSATPARVVVATATPDAFALLASTRALAAGANLGTHSAPMDHDDHQLVIPAGFVGRAYLAQGPGGLSAWKADGTPLGPPQALVAGPARVVYRVAAGAPQFDQDYVLVAVLATPEPEAPLLTPGEHEDALAPGASRTYSFWVDQAQRFRVETEHAPHASIRILALDGAHWDGSSAKGDTGSVLAARASRSGIMNVTIGNDHGASAFTLRLWVDPDGHLADKPTLQTFFAVEPTHEPSPFLGMAGEGRGVDVHLRAGPNAPPDLFHVDADGQATWLGHAYASARTADGGFVAASPTLKAIALGLDPSATPIAHQALFALGPDGTYVAGTTPAWFPADGGAPQPLALPPRAYRFLSGPAGVHAVTLDGGVHLLDGAAGTSAPTAIHPASLALDADGGAYRIVNETLVVRESASGELRVAARAPPLARVRDLTLNEDGLVAYVVEGAGPALTHALARAPVSHAPFLGHRPAVTAAPLADLVVEIADEPLGPRAEGGRLVEDHRATITVRNVGAGHALSTWYDVYDDCALVSGCMVVASGPLPRLAPGESVTFERDWTARGAGDASLRARVDSRLWWLEADETNNEAMATTRVLIGGNQALCRAALDAAGAPEPAGACSRRV